MLPSVIIILWGLYGVCDAEISDRQYALMPDLFYLENFDKCMLKENEVLFCTFTFSVKYLDGSNSTVWNIIQNISSNPQNYRHDILRHGICVPDSCADDYNNYTAIKDIIQSCYNKKYSSYGLIGNVSNVSCQSNISSYHIDIYDLLFGVFLLVYIVFAIFASFYERCLLLRYEIKQSSYEKKTSNVAAFIAAFSIPKNWYRLTSTQRSSEYRKLKGIQGIRFYNMICVILSHTVMSFLAGPISNPKYTENSTKKILNMFLANGWYVVQTFFVISGWLISFHFFEMIEKTKNFKSIYFLWAILNRYIRLFPALAFMIAFHSTWLVHLSRGPYWDMFVGEEYRNCRQNWWTNILFINNYVNNNHMCLHQSWYIASDLQLFILSMFILSLILKYPSKVKYIFGTVLFIGFCLPGFLAYINKYDIVVRQYPEVLYNLNLLKLQHWHVLYSSAYSNIFGYSIGMLFGYIYVTHRSTNFVFKKIHIVFWWILTFGMCILVVLVAIIFYEPNFIVTPLKSALYWSFGKNLFALGGAIFIFGLTQKIGWFARWVCEFQPVQVLGRLTYSTYLIHVVFARLQLGYRRFPTSANDSIIFIAVLGDVACAYLAGTVLCLLVEMPVSALQKMLKTYKSDEGNTLRPQKRSETLDLANNGHQNNVT